MIKRIKEDKGLERREQRPIILIIDHVHNTYPTLCTTENRREKKNVELFIIENRYC